MISPWLPGELWAEVEIRQFDSLTDCGRKNRAWAVKQWADVMLHIPVSDELASFLSKVKRAQLEDALKGPPRMKRSWRVQWFQNPDRGNVWEGRIEEYDREVEEWEI